MGVQKCHFLSSQEKGTLTFTLCSSSHRSISSYQYSHRMFLAAPTSLLIDQCNGRGKTDLLSQPAELCLLFLFWLAACMQKTGSPGKNPHKAKACRNWKGYGVGVITPAFLRLGSFSIQVTSTTPPPPPHQPTHTYTHTCKYTHAHTNTYALTHTDTLCVHSKQLIYWYTLCVHSKQLINIDTHRWTHLHLQIVVSNDGVALWSWLSCLASKSRLSSLTHTKQESHTHTNLHTCMGACPV